MTYPAVGEVLLSLALGECDLTELAANGRSWGNRTTTSSDCSVGPKCTQATMARTITPAALDTLLDDTYRCPAGQRAIYRMTSIEHGLRLHRYWPSACPRCPLKARCTPGDYRRITRWEHEVILETMQRRLDRQPQAMTLRRRTIEHVFGTLKHWMGSTHFLMRGLKHVATEMSLHVLAYNLKRVIKLLGMAKTIKAMRLLSA